MQDVSTILIVLLAMARPLVLPSRGFDAIKLLPGYHVTSAPGIDVTAWTIQKPGGLIIHFEAGPSEGLAVDPRDKSKYAWWREQTMCGRTVLIALTRPGVSIGSDADEERHLPPGNILMVAYPLGGHKDHAANFIGKVANSEEIADMLLMALTFDPSKGVF